MSTDKSPVRVEIERQILAALSGSDRPMTLRELVPIVDAAEGPQQIARILGYMRADGQIANGPDVQPDEPGGLSGKGARPVASYQLRREPAILQGKSADIDLIAALKMIAAADDDGEVCMDDELEWARNANSRAAALDSAGGSQNGDEFEMPISGLGELHCDPGEAAFEWTPEMAERRLAYAECSDNIAFERDVLELREIADQAALDVADALIRGSQLRAWEAVQRMHRAVVGFSDDYV
jgi:hypothetical protein